MFYVFSGDAGLTSKFIYFRELPADFEAAVWMTGERFQVPPAPMTLVAQDEKPDRLSDKIGRAHV